MLRRLIAVLAALIAATSSLVLVASPAGAQLAGAAKRPGVYIDEIAAFGDSIVTVATGIPLFIGVGAPTRPVNLRGPGDLPAGASPTLRTAVDQFFLQCAPQCGNGAWVVGASSASGSAIAALANDPAAITVGSPSFGVPDLYVAPDLGSLSGTEWVEAATAMTRVAARNKAVALLDAPQAMVKAAMASPSAIPALTALTATMRTSLGADASAAFLLGSGVISGGTVIGAAAPYAGVLAKNDTLEGVWNSAANATFDGLDAQWSPTGVAAGALNVSGVAILRNFPGRGAVVWSERTVYARGSGRYVTNVRTLDTMQRSIGYGLQSYVFAANDAVTWSRITAQVSNYLNGWWKQGALQGATASMAYSVECGIGSTMTAQDILNGHAYVDISVNLNHYGGFSSWTQMLQMQTS